MQKALYFSNFGTTYISDFIPVDVEATYEASMNIRSIGREESKVYFFVDCYDKDRKQITDLDVNRVMSFPPVTIIGISENRKIISIEEEETDWDSNVYNRLCFYLDGDMDKLPFTNFISNNILLRKTSTEIELGNPIDKAVDFKLGVSKARLHRSGGTYMYPACSNQSVPYTWTKYEEKVQGEIFAAKNNQFRLGTKEVKIGFLANYQQQGKEVEFIVKDLTFTKTKTEFKL